MYGNIFKPLVYLAYIGIAAVLLLIVASPFALWWAYQHVRVVVK